MVSDDSEAPVGEPEAPGGVPREAEGDVEVRDESARSPELVGDERDDGADDGADDGVGPEAGGDVGALEDGDPGEGTARALEEAGPTSSAEEPDEADDPEVPPGPTTSPRRPGSRPVHWLVRIAERAGHSTERLDLPPDTPVADAWGTVARAMGITSQDLAARVAGYFRLEAADLPSADPNAILLVPEKMARKHHVYAIAETDRHLFVATSDPTDVEAERALGFTTGRTVVFEVAPPEAIEDLLNDRFAPDAQVESLLGSIEDDSIDTVKLVEEMGPESITEEEVSATPVVKLTNLMLRDGIAQGASDIHIEPGRKVGVVRYRVDGVLRKHMDLPMSALNRVISRVKILSKLDIADRLRPQDGKARVRIKNLSYDLRVSTIPAGGAEKCVIRVLDSNAAVTLEDLDVPGPELERLRQLLTYRDGVVVVTGPTGSGKTTTLYGALRELADGKVNIMTVEDPIEYELAGITQTQVEVKQGMTFAAALRSMLRQDPDVILVGEIRDRETAEVAAQAAMTGHLVLATVHANDAVSAISRLADMGLQWSTISATLRGGLAQRLMRKVCPACAEPVRGMLTPEEQRLTERHGIEPVVRAVGCPECGFTGYKGRLPVVEVMSVGPRMQVAIEQRKGWGALSRVAQQGGMRPMHQVALDWVTHGKTTLVEVERVLGQIIDEEPAEQAKGPPRVLVVDDDEEDRLLLRTLLEDEQYEITEAEDGDKAIDVLKEDPDYSLVILDLSMPRMDGWEVLRWIRGNADTTALPVLVRTGVGTDQIEAELLEAGADDYLGKSTDATRFMARVKAVLRRSMV